MEKIYCVPDCKIWKGEKNHCLFNGSHALTSCSMQSSINPLNMRDPIRICSGLAWKHLPEVGWMIVAHRLASRLDTFGENLTQSPRTELDLGWFHTVWSWTSVEEHNRVWKWETGSGPVASYQKPDLLVPAHWLAFRPDAFGQTLTRSSRSDAGQFCTIWTMPSLEKRNWIGCRKSDQAHTTWPDCGCTLAVSALTGCIQNASGWDPACLLGTCHLLLFLRNAGKKIFGTKLNVNFTCAHIQRLRRVNRAWTELSDRCSFFSLLLQRQCSPAGSLGAREWHCGDQRQPDDQPFAIRFLSRQVLSQRCLRYLMLLVVLQLQQRH